MNEKSPGEFNDRRGKLDPEPSYDYPKRRRSKIKFSISLAITLSISILILIPLSFIIGRYSVSQNSQVEATNIHATPQIAPTSDPTQVPPVVNTLNSQLICQHCEEANVIAFIKSYVTDTLGYTSLTLLFINHTSQAVDMKVDTIKLLDQKDNPIPVHSNDPYVPVGVGQTTPTTVVFQLVPQSASKYMLSIVMEEANVFANFYQSTPLILSQ